MIKIISAIDFSKCSIHALEYTINLANHVSADVIMVWVDTTPLADTDMSVISREHRIEIKSQFDEVMDKYAPTLKKGELSFKLRKGKVYQEIANQAKYDDVSIIVAGSHGVSGFEKFWIGSNAYRMVSSAPCPVITIRHDFNFRKKINKIVVPIDDTLETRQKVPFTVRIAKLYGSELHLTAVYSTKFKTIRRKVDHYVEQVAKFVYDHNVKFKVEVLEADNITTSVIAYCDKINADLVSIMTEQETTASNIILGPYAQQMVNNSAIPVLSIQAREIMKIMTGS
jgi:nucleotide-binding universal stress UspA family protein